MHVRAHGAEPQCRLHAQLPADRVRGCDCCGVDGAGTGAGVRLRPLRGIVPCVDGVDAGASSVWFEFVPEPEVVDALLAGAGAATAR
jgi:hypothetical protein